MTFLTLNYFFDKNLFNFYNFIFVLFSNFIGINCLFSIYLKNPVFSLIFLIINYISSSILMLVFGLQLIAFVFLLIYVGAISILLLFTLMLLNLKVIFYKSVNYVYFLFFIITIIFLQLILFSCKDLLLLFYYAEVDSVNWFSIIFFKNEIQNFGLEIFVINKDLVFLSTIFLFLILIASINVVMSVKYSKKQLLDIQLKNVNKNIKK